MPAFGLGVVAELLVPAWAERAGITPWHPHHIAERYSLFYIIVLGETVLSTTVAIQQALTAHELHAGLISVIAGGVLIVFSTWWLYFFRDAGDALEGPVLRHESMSGDTTPLPVICSPRLP